MRSASFKLGTAFGIEVYLHWTFLLLPAVLAGYGFARDEHPGMIALRAVLLLIILASVFLHELAHALAARTLRIGTIDIVLTPLCGLARLERSPETSWEEIAVSLAGPLANGMIAGMAALAIWISGGKLTAYQQVGELRLLPAIFWFNLALFLINLIPVFPMDGGRVLRAVLRWSLGARRSTTIAVRAGQIVSLAATIAGLVSGDYIIPVIGVFLIFMAQQELRTARRDQDGPEQ